MSASSSQEVFTNSESKQTLILRRSLHLFRNHIYQKTGPELCFSFNFNCADNFPIKSVCHTRREREQIFPSEKTQQFLWSAFMIWHRFKLVYVCIQATGFSRKGRANGQFPRPQYSSKIRHGSMVLHFVSARLLKCVTQEHQPYRLGFNKTWAQIN